MKGMERLTTVRLAEALSQSGMVVNEKITDALHQQDSTGVPFVDVLVDSGDISEWEISRLVVQHFHLPFLMASCVEINEKAKTALPTDFLFEHRILPLAVLGSVLSLSMPVIVPFNVLQDAEKLSGHNVFPFVGLRTENLKFLHELFPEQPRIDVTKGPQSGEQQASGGWQNIFDVGDQQVLKDLGM